MPISRRDFIRTAATGGGIALAGSTAVLGSAPGALAEPGPSNRHGHGHDEDGHGHAPGYGPLVPDPDGVLAVPWLRLPHRDPHLPHNQAMRCFDVGGTFVPDLSAVTETGTVHGVAWVDVPDRDARKTAKDSSTSSG